MGIMDLVSALVRSLFLIVSLAVTSIKGATPKEIEAQLFTVLGMRRRPKPTNRQIPEYMIELYQQQSGLEFETTNFASRGKLTGSANILRSTTSSNKHSHVVTTSKSRTYFTFDVLPALARSNFKGGFVIEIIPLNVGGQSVSWNISHPSLLTYSDDGKYQTSLSGEKKREKTSLRRERRGGRRGGSTTAGGTRCTWTFRTWGGRTGFLLRLVTTLFSATETAPSLCRSTSTPQITPLCKL